MTDEEIEACLASFEAEATVAYEEGATMLVSEHQASLRGFLDFAKELRHERDIYRMMLEREQRRNARGCGC